jgi:energy-coupling factor transporter ATP-binding protein EcfA2
MSRVVQVEVDGLFGHVHHVVSLRSETPTIITAPNGAGKTHILTLLAGALALDLKILLLTPYSSFLVSFSNGHQLRIVRTTDDDKGVRVSLEDTVEGVLIGQPLELGVEVLESDGRGVPAHFRKIAANRWYDARTGRTFPRSVMQRRYRLDSAVPEELAARSPEVIELCSGPEPVLIDTKRLDFSGLEPRESEFDEAGFRETSGAATRIHEYMEQLRAEVTEARRSSIQATQSADLSFAARALAAASLSVKETALHKRYDETVERYENLARNSLAVGQAPMKFPEQTNPTVRRILSVFLDDWDQRLEPLLSLNEKIQTLRDILDAKLAPSGKRTGMSSRGILEFRSATGRRISVENLSSGEQHMVVPGSLVLIDEPEISFHAAWKHSFLDDISRVSQISDLQVVMATHSSAIVNGRWDLAEELSFEASSQRELEDGVQGNDDGDDYDE